MHSQTAKTIEKSLFFPYFHRKRNHSHLNETFFDHF